MTKPIIEGVHVPTNNISILNQGNLTLIGRNFTYQNIYQEKSVNDTYIEF